MRILIPVLLTCLIPYLPATDAWIGEPLAQATDLGAPTLGLDPANHFFEMSDAHWNATTRTLWTVDARSGSTVIYGLAANVAGTAFTVSGQFSASSDVEGLTQASDQDVLYLLYEGSATIQARRISTGAAIRSWDLGPTLDAFANGNAGPEGITFIPDASLAASGFTRGDTGAAYPASTGGLGGIFLVAHQNGGHLYAFDLAATASHYTYLGRFATGAGESSGLAFDRSNHRLFISHNTGSNPIEITTLASTGVPGARTLNQMRLINGPQGGNVEGIAVTPALKADGTPGDGWFFTVTDHDRAGAYQAHNIVWYDGLGTSLAISAGNGQSALVGSAVPVKPQVRVLDKWGDPLVGLTVTFAIQQGGGDLSGASVVVDSTGLATLGGWILGGTAGPNTLTASAPGLVPVTFTATGTGTAIAPTTIRINAGNGQTATVGTAVAEPPSVIVTDVRGNPLAGVAVDFAVTAGGGTINAALVMTTTMGIATPGSWILGGTAGVNRLTARVVGRSSLSVAFTATGTPGGPATIAVNAGDNQTVSVGYTVAVPPAVIIKDTAGNPVPGVPVTFSVTAGGGTITAATATTSTAGLARVGSWTLGMTTGTNTLRAQTAGLICDIGATAVTQPETAFTMDVATIIGNCPDAPDLEVVTTVDGTPVATRRQGDDWTATVPMHLPLQAVVCISWPGKLGVDFSLQISVADQFSQRLPPYAGVVSTRGLPDRAPFARLRCSHQTRWRDAATRTEAQP